MEDVTHNLMPENCTYSAHAKTESWDDNGMCAAPMSPSPSSLWGGGRGVRMNVRPFVFHCGKGGGDKDIT